MIRPNNIITLLLLITLTSCSSLPSKTERSAAITVAGNASIEQWRERGVFGTQWTTIHHLDGEFPTDGRGVFPLAPGRHEIDVIASFSRVRVGLYVDGGGGTLSFTAEPGRRYRARARAFDTSRAEIWIEDVDHAKDVTPRLPITLQTTKQDTPPPLIFIPVS